MLLPHTLRQLVMALSVLGVCWAVLGFLAGAEVAKRKIERVWPRFGATSYMELNWPWFRSTS